MGDSVEYRLVQQQETDSEGEDTIRRSRTREQIPLRVRAGAKRNMMNLSVYNRPLFQTAALTVSVIGLTLVITTIAWVGKFKGGVAFSHKEKLKLGHAGIMMVAFILMVIGLQAAFDSHNLANPPKPNMYTLHSWVGLFAAVLFGCQWTLGFLAFLFTKFSGDIRALLLPFHQYLGSSILVLAAAAALMGHLEKAIWSNKEYSLKNAEAVLVNVTGLLIILFVMGVTFLLSTFKKDEPDKR